MLLTLKDQLNNAEWVVNDTKPPRKNQIVEVSGTDYKVIKVEGGTIYLKPLED